MKWFAKLLTKLCIKNQLCCYIYISDALNSVQNKIDKNYLIISLYFMKQIISYYYIIRESLKSRIILFYWFSTLFYFFENLFDKLFFIWFYLLILIKKIILIKILIKIILIFWHSVNNWLPIADQMFD